MILVTLGTQDKKFYRLLKLIDNAIDNGLIKDEVIVQAGCSCDYKSSNMKIFDLIEIDKFSKMINKADLIISHGGVGSIISGLKANKKIIAVPRLSKYKEHVNDHQLQIVSSFTDKGYILSCGDLDNFNEVLRKIEDFKPKKYVSNTLNMVKIIEKEIDRYL